MRDHRPHLDVVAVGGIADLQRLDRRHEVLEQGVVDLRPGDDARAGGAVLAGVPEAGDLDPLRDLLGVGIVEDDHRRLAAELEVHALQRVGGVLRDQLAGLDVARQRDEPDVGMLDQALACGHAVAGHDLQHAFRDHVLRQLDEAEQRKRRLLGRLQDVHVAGGEARAHLPDSHHQRVVPRADAGDDPDRLPANQRRVPLDVLACRLPFEVARRAREEAQVVGGERHLVARDHQRLADVARLDLRELLGVVLEDLRELVQELRPLLRRRVEPLGQRLLRALDDLVDLVGRHVRHRVDRLGGCGVDHVERCHASLL